MLRDLNELVERIRGKKKIVAIAGAEDKEAIKAVSEAQELGVSAILFGKKEIIEKNLSEIGVEYPIVDCRTDEESSKMAVKYVADGKAHIVMKGLVKTSTLLKAVLDKEYGLRTERLLSHITLLEVPGINRLIFLTDGGMVIRPTLEQKVQIIENAVDVAKKLGYEMPKVGIIAAVETVNPDMPETLEAALIAKMNERGQIKGCKIDGPLGIDNALSVYAAEVKGIKGEVAGHADILVVPDIHSGNFLGKSAVYFANGRIAGIIAGAKAPVIVISRADTSDSKFVSIALAMALS
ncbi:MAG TPA: bifunctional enoyl-CoA hydratase/phosphate acetyltransferase [Fervidobacterium sp.]|nr:bifunctional enoyl-CoA hydratase/phosphate acetyltransferase [Fervidobacterium sp.]HOL03612.1 bifunctional enoyl-CoA hydratase/phosphate acetyltransferase [Fervidobacterium sp.]HON04514.1 bifunctional enoyl-CoA hydratase/phosphate acetyltransferase [Fervidobacterium sp.]HPT58800.1 bifunctional enoyl-CoA hydratase/phosphate acetyltransferase [Fervidobacterium sp.]HRB91008.1 bifunctional enoyl-CoA hydratase/phosphate acetyltransferase [Fervidobacterium sp.]